MTGEAVPGEGSDAMTAMNSTGEPPFKLSKSVCDTARPNQQCGVHLTRSRFTAAAAAMTMLSATATHAQDIYIGTLSVEGSQLVLKRCDLVQNTYTLHDEKGDTNGAVSQFKKHAAHTRGIWYAEVAGVYEKREGKDALLVMSLDNVQAGKSCHLLDVPGFPKGK